MNNEECIKQILVNIGENPDRPGLKDTPNRVARMFKEIFRGYDEAQKPRVTTFKNGLDGIKYNQMVVDNGPFYSQCEHHMVPFIGHYWVAIIFSSKGNVVGQ